MRLIDADALIHRMCTHCTEYEECTSKNGDCDDFDMIMINNAPRIEAEQIKHGKWIFGESMHRPWMKCSECLVSQTPTEVFSFCPNCGAKMDGE